MSKSYHELKKSILDSKGTTFWLKRAILELDNRDVIDALSDAEILAEMMSKKWGELKLGVKKV